MAVDTRDKRQSFFSHGGRYWMGKAYDPNGALDAAHRLFSLTFYSGNILSGIVYVAIGGLFLFTDANWNDDLEFFLETSVRATTGTANVRLFDVTADIPVASSNVSTASTILTRLRSSALTLTDGNVYQIQAGVLSGDSGAITGAKLVAT